MAKTVLVLIVLVMFSIGLFIVSKVGVFLKESKKEASDAVSYTHLTLPTKA